MLITRPDLRISNASAPLLHFYDRRRSASRRKRADRPYGQAQSAEFQLALRKPAVLSSIVKRLVEEVASKLLIRWGQSVRSRAIPVPLGTLELRGDWPNRSLRQSGHRNSPAGKAPIVLSSPDLANTGHRKPVRNHYTHTRRNIRSPDIRSRRIRSQGTTNKGSRTQRNQNR